MFFRLLVFLSFLFAFDANCSKPLEKFCREVKRINRTLSDVDYVLDQFTTGQRNQHTRRVRTSQQYGYQTQPLPTGVDRYLDYTPEHQVRLEPRIEEGWYDDIRFHPIKDEIAEAYARSGLSGKELDHTKQKISRIFNDEEILEIDAWLLFAFAKIECERDGYDDSWSAEHEDRSIPEEYARRISWCDKRQLDLVGNQKDFPIINGIMRRATFLRYDIEKFREENYAEYQRIIGLIETYYAGILVNNVRIVLASAIESGGTTLVAAAATCAVFSGVEVLVQNILEKGGDELSWKAARKDKSLYASYLKTCDFFVDFVEQYGLLGSLKKKLPVGRSHAFAFNGQGKLLSQRVVKSSSVSKSVQHKEQAGTSGKKVLQTRSWHQLSKAEKTQCQMDFLRKKLASLEWEDSGHKIKKQKAYYCKKTGLYYTKVKGEKCDFEVWKVTGKKAKHQGAIESLNGTKYEEAKHPDALFE